MTRARTALIVAAFIGGVLFWLTDLLLFRLGVSERAPLIFFFSGSLEELLERLFLLLICLGLGIPLLLDWRKLRAAEAQLRRDRDFIQNLLDTAPAIILVLDCEGRIRHTNAGADELTGCRSGMLVGIDWFERFVPPDERSAARDRLQRCLRGDSLRGIVDTVVTPEGRARSVAWQMRPLHDDAGAITAVLAVGRDLTESLTVEEALAQERRLFIGGPTVIVKWRAHSTRPIEYVSANVTSRFGYLPTDMLDPGFHYLDIVHPEDAPRVNAQIEDNLKAGLSFYETEYRLRHRNGEYRWVTDFTCVIRDSQGSVVSFHGYLNDITERKQSEERMKAGLRRLEIINRIVTLANRAEDAANLMPEVLREVIDLLGFDAGAVYLFDEIAGHGSLLCSQGLPRSFLDRVLQVRLDEIQPVIRNTVFGERQSYLTGDPQVLSRAFAEFSGMKAVAFIPLFIQNRIVGTMNLARHDTHEFTSEDRLLLLSISQEIGTAIARLQAEQSLHDRDLLLSKLSSQTPGMLYQFLRRPDGSYSMPFCSASAQEIFRIDPALLRDSFEYVSRSVLPEDLEELVRSIEESARTLAPWDHEFRVKIGDEPVHWVRGQSSPERLADGAVLWHGFLTDITVRKQAEATLRESELRYRTVVEKSTDWLLIHRHGRLLFVNPALARAAGYGTCGEMLAAGKGAIDYVHPDSRALVAERMRLSMGSDQALPVTEEKFLMPNGRMYIGEVVAQRIVFDGEPAALVVIRDVTERHQTEARLRTALRQLEDIIDFLPDATFVVDRQGKVIAWNHAIERMTGVPAQDMIGLGDRAYTVPFYGHRRPALVDLLFQENEEMERKYHGLVRTDRILAGEAFTPGIYGGKGAYVSATASPLFNDQGEVIGAIESIRDITDRKRAEEALREAERISREYAVDLAAANEELSLANEKLREIDRQKSEFLASVAHELRTPLAITHGAVENLLTGMLGEVSEQQQHLLSIVNRNTARLGRLIDNLLELSRIDARQFSLRRARADLGEIARLTVENFLPLIDRQGIALSLDLPRDPVPAEVDSDKIVQILTNFLDNALRYARSRVVVTLALEPGQARLAVLDDGPGVPDKNLSRLFRRFARIETPQRKSHIGLGLSIVKAIAEAHGGRAEAENVSQPFPGTRFSFILPRPADGGKS